MAFDPTGPGTPAWEHSDAAILAGILGDTHNLQVQIDLMTQELLKHNASSQTIREWENFIHTSIAENRMSAAGEWLHD